MKRDTANRYWNIIRHSIFATCRLGLQVLLWLSIAAVLLTVAYFLSEPFERFAKWYVGNNVAPRVIVLILAPLAAAAAIQIRVNLIQQGERREPKSIRRAYRQMRDNQTAELLLGWLTWLAFTVGATAFTQLVELF